MLNYRAAACTRGHARDAFPRAALLRCAVGDTISVKVNLEREGEVGVSKVHAPFYSKLKEEGWWLVVANTATNELLSIKHMTMAKLKYNAQLDFEAPAEAGEVEYTLMFMSDSYTGCDQEYEFTVKVAEEEEDEEEEEEEEKEDEEEDEDDEDGKKRKEVEDEDDSEGKAKKQRKD